MKKWFKFFDNSVGKNLLIPLVSSIVSLTVLLAMLSPADALTNDVLSELTETETSQVEEPSEEVPGVEEPSVDVPKVEEPGEETPEVEKPSEETPEVEEPSEERPEVEEPIEETPGVEEPSVEVPEVEEPSEETPDVEEPGVETPEVDDSNAEIPEVTSRDDNVTTDTFESLGGEYSFKYIFNNYNVFSFRDVEAKHIVGPIITQDFAYGAHTKPGGNNSDGRLIASDLSKGISSYIGKVQRAGRWESSASVNLNYHYDTNKVVNFYANNKDNILKFENTNYEFMDSNGYFKSPNATGSGPSYQNDNFIDFDRAKQLLLNESFRIASKATNIEVTPDSTTGVLNLEVGKSYVIRDASKLNTVNLIYPDGYHPITNPYPYNTIITILDDSLPVSGTTFEGLKDSYPLIENQKYQFFPEVEINGEPFNGNQSGNKTPDYGENNSVIWNMPNLIMNGEQNRLTKYGGSDILGHIFAPNVEFWNVKAEGNKATWRGGNINGCAIVASWHGGTMESHMWPYAEGETDEVMFKFSAAKSIIGGLGDKQFQFELSLFDDNSKVDGLEQNVFPQVVTVVGDGKIDFLPLRITKPGTYTFRIKEKIPEVPEDNVIYDRSEYKLTLDVEVTPSGDDLSITSKITKVKDELGNPLSPEVEVDKVVFENKEGDAITPAKLNLNGHKTLIDGMLTEGQFKFSLELLTANPQDGVSSENTSQTVANASDGSLVFAPITFTKAGTYEFIVKEIMSDPVDEDIVYDKREYKWTVNVTLDSEDNKKLIATATLVDNETGELQSNEATFVNRINLNPVDLSVTGIKQLIDGTLTEGQFTFKLELMSANPVDGVLSENLPQTVSNLSDGAISFLPLTFTKEGTYVFSIKEEIPELVDDTIIYDQSEYQLTVTVRKEMVEEKAVLVTDSKLVKLKDSTGVELTSEVIVEDILFVNKLDYDFKLPETGGEGRLGYMGLGLSLMGLALCLVSKKLKQSTKL